MWSFVGAVTRLPGKRTRGAGGSARIGFWGEVTPGAEAAEMETAEPSPPWRGLGNRDLGLGGHSWEASPADLVLGSDAGGGVFVPESTLGLTNDAGRVTPISEGYTVIVFGANFAAQGGRSAALNSATEACVAGSLEACAASAEAAGDRYTIYARVLTGRTSAFIVSDASALVFPVPSPSPVLSPLSFLPLLPFTAARAAPVILTVAGLANVEATEMSLHRDLGGDFRLLAQTKTSRSGRERGSRQRLNGATP